MIAGTFFVQIDGWTVAESGEIFLLPFGEKWPEGPMRGKRC